MDPKGCCLLAKAAVKCRQLQRQAAVAAAVAANIKHCTPGVRQTFWKFPCCRRHPRRGAALGAAGHARGEGKGWIFVVIKLKVRRQRESKGQHDVGQALTA